MEQLQSTCLTLLNSVLSHPVGFPTLQLCDDETALVSILNEKEQQLLGIHDKLHYVLLEKRILEAELGGDGTNENDEDNIKSLEKELLISIANRQLKDSVVENYLASFPILTAVHADGVDERSDKERHLLWLIQRRDTLSLTHANVSHLLKTTLDSLSKAEKEYVEIQERNKVLAAELLELGKKCREEIKRQQRGSEYEAVNEEFKREKMGWNVVRNVYQGVIAASGVDWANDEMLRELMLSCGDD